MTSLRKSSAPLAAIALSLALTLVGCGSDSGSDTASSTSTASSSAAAASSKSDATTTDSTPTEAEGANYTIADYIKDQQIVETPIHPGDANAPTIDLPSPAGWENAGADTPDGAYGAIVYAGPESATYQPTVIAIVSKLEGEIDPQKLIDYAGNEVKNLPGFMELSPGSTSTLSSYPAYEIGGTYTKDGEELLIAQKTTVIPGKDGLYILQLNVDAAGDQVDLVAQVTTEIDEKTTITP